MSIWRKKPQALTRERERILMGQMACTETRSDYPIHVLPLHAPPKTHPALACNKSLLSAHPFSQSSPSHPPSLMSFWMTLFLPDVKAHEGDKRNASADSGRE